MFEIEQLEDGKWLVKSHEFRIPPDLECWDTENQAGFFVSALESAVKCGKRMKAKQLKRALGIADNCWEVSDD